VNSVSVTGPSTETIDICIPGENGGHDRSVDDGRTWGTVTPGPDCQSPHSIAVSPGDANVLFATFPISGSNKCWEGSTLHESPDGGQSWVDLGACSTSTRPQFVVTHPSFDQNSSHFDLYYSGRQITCSYTPVAPTGQHCPSNTNDDWNFLPTGSLNHDINGVGFDSGVGFVGSSNCAIYEAADFGVYRMGNPSPGNPCGDPAAWTIAGNSGAGFGALQIYQVAGYAQFPITGGVLYVSGHTNLFFATMDNGIWGTFDAGVSKWQCFGPSPSTGDCDSEGSFLQVSQQALVPTQVTLDASLFPLPGVAAKAWLDQVSGVLSPDAYWTSIDPPGNASPPVLVADNTYVAWSGTKLFLTQDSGQSWVLVGTLPSNVTQLQPPYYNTRNTRVSSTPTGPAIFERVVSNTGAQGIALLKDFLPPPNQPLTFSIQTLNQGTWRNCFGQANYCVEVYAPDPNDYNHLYAVDPINRSVVFSTTAGTTWQPDNGLTNLVTAGGTSFTDSNGDSQIHVFAFDPANSAHILVGSDSAGIFASANGGMTWSALPNTAKARAISSFFFDSRTNTVYVGTYGRGLWKLTVDWTTVH
jgi:hypothetical protein